MIITDALIKATANTYTAEELRDLIKQAVLKLQESEYIVSASTGSGSSYTRQQRISVQSQIELYQAALSYLEGTPEENHTQFTPIIFQTLI